MLIGLSGKRGAGKDAVAAALVANHGFTRVAFADQLKTMLYAQNPYVLAGGSFVGLAGLVDHVGWDIAKSSPDVRSLLQRAGQWMFTVDKMFWVHAATSQLPTLERVVITDLRFDHERDWLRDHNGWVVRVNRVNHAIADHDPSETVADAWFYDLTVHNTVPDTSPDFLAALVVHELSR